MNQLEQFKEQCAKELEKYIDHTVGAEECADIIRAIPVPEVAQEPVVFIREDSLQRLMQKDGTLGFGATVFKEERPSHPVPLFLMPPDFEALRKENETLREALIKCEEEAHNASDQTCAFLRMALSDIKETASKALGGMA